MDEMKKLIESLEKCVALNVTTNGQAATEPRKIKKKRRRKISKSLNQDNTTSSENGYSSDEAITQVENRIQSIGSNNSTSTVIKTSSTLDQHDVIQGLEIETNHTQVDESVGLEDNNEENKEENEVDRLSLQNENNSPPTESITNTNNSISNDHFKEKELLEKACEENNDSTDKDSHKDELVLTKKEESLKNKSFSQSDEISSGNCSQQEDTQEDVPEHCIDHVAYPTQESKFNLNAQEFVPRAYRNVEPVPVDPNLQFINIHSNFVPLPIINHHLNELNPPPFNQTFLPPGIPFNFMTTDPKLLPNFVNLVPNQFVPPKSYEQPSTSSVPKTKDITETDDQSKTKTSEPQTKDTGEIKEEIEKQDNPAEEKVEIENVQMTIYKNDVDIAKIVSKLEEAAKEQKYYENRRQDFRSPNKFKKPIPKYNNTYQNDYKQNSYRSNADHRRPRRFDNKSNESSESRLKEIKTTATGEIVKLPEKLGGRSEEIQSEVQIKIDVKEAITKANEEERKYSPRHQNYKNQNSPRRYMNYNRNIKSKTPEMSYSAPTINYSDSLKKSFNGKSCPRFDKCVSERINIIPKQMPIKKSDESKNEASKSISVNMGNQWISVSSRKKRKNKSNNEDDNESVKEDISETLEVFDKTTESDQQENQVKNILTSKNSADSEKKYPNDSLPSSINVDNFIEMVANSESSPIKMCSKINTIDSQVLLKDVKDIEEELLKDSIKVITAAQNETKTEENTTEINESPFVETKVQKDASRRKRKGIGKNSTKRLIILDPDTSRKDPGKKDKFKSKIDIEKSISENAQPKEDVKEVIQTDTDISSKKSSDNLGNDVNTSVAEEVMLDNNEPVSIEISPENVATPEKKKNKKKKKQVKASLSTSVPSISSSSTTLNNIDDSYDFLLDTSALVEEKTNLEVSEELDKMIQKGLFGNLEEKFRSLNVSVDDDFFKSLTLKTKAQSTPEKGFIKATNFTTILNNVNQSLSKDTSEDQNTIDIDFSKIKLPDYEPQPSTSKNIDFLEMSIPEEVGPPENTEVKLNTKSNGKLRNKSKKHLSENDTNIISNATSKNQEYTADTDSKEENNSTIPVFFRDDDESKLKDFFQKEIETELHLKNNLTTVNELNLHKLCNEDQIKNICDDDICQDIHVAPKIEISSTDLCNGYESESNIEDDDHIKVLDEHIVIEFVKNEKEEHNVITEIGSETAKDNETELFLKNESPKSFPDVITEMKPLYPITQAVREWMTKTRETTPEIEILKSPNTIYKEFIEHSEEEDDASDKETNQKNGKSNPSFVGYFDQNEVCHISMNARVAKSNVESEVTTCETWSMSQDTSIQEEDLLDCWEPDILDVKKEELLEKSEPIEEAEDVLEVYGKDEDFLRLKAEIAMEETRQDGIFNRHSNLPYRAICCSLM